MRRRRRDYAPPDAAGERKTEAAEFGGWRRRRGDRIGGETGDFFEFGSHSILAIRLPDSRIFGGRRMRDGRFVFLLFSL